MIAYLVHRRSLQAGLFQQRKKKTAQRPKRKKLPSSIPDPPPPAGNKAQYGVGEFLKIIYGIHPKKRRKMSAKMRSERFGYVPISESSVYRLFQDYENGEHFEFDQEWRRGGRQPRISNSRLEDCAKQLAISRGRKEMKERVNDILVEEEQRKGLMPAGGKKSTLQL